MKGHIKKRRALLHVSLVALILLLGTSSAGAQERGADDAALRARIAELEALESPGSEQAAELTELKAALDFLKQVEESTARRQALVEEARGAPAKATGLQAELDSARADLKRPVDLGLEPPPAGATLGELETALGRVRAGLEAAEAKRGAARQILQSVESERADVAARTDATPRDLVAFRSRAQQVRRNLAGLPEEPERPALHQATKTRLLAETDALAARIAEREQELETISATETLRELRVALARAQLDVAGRRADAWRSEVDQRRQAVARQRTVVAEAERDRARNTHPVVRAILDRNAELAREYQEQVVQPQSDYDRQRAETSELIATWTEIFGDVRQEIDQVGLGSMIGLRLRDLRVQLVDLKRLEAAAARVRKESERSRSRNIRLKSDRFGDPGTDADRLIAVSEDPVPEGRRAAVRSAAVAALRAQQELVLELRTVYGKYTADTLIPLQEAHLELAALVSGFLRYIDERLLWIRSTHPLNAGDVAGLGRSISWLFEGRNWAAVGRVAGRRLSERPFHSAALLLPFLVLLLLRPRLLRSLAASAGMIQRASTDRIGWTVRAAVVTILLALAWPALPWALSWLIRGSEHEFVAALSASLERVAGIVLFLTIFWHLCRSGGLGECHFRWDTENLNLVRRHLCWFVAAFLPFYALVHLTDSVSFREQHDSLGRLAFCVMSVLLTVFLWTVLHPKRGVLKGMLAAREGGWIDRLKPIWFPVIYCLPLASALLACLGYFFTARDVSHRLALTIWLFVGASILSAMLSRWLFVARRRMAIEQYVRRREAERQAAREAEQEESEEEIPVPEESELGLEEISAQAKSLVRSAITVLVLIGLYGAWADTLPALSLFDQYVVWMPGDAVIDHGPDGSPILPPAAITVADLFLAAIIAFLTLAVSRNIPGVLEIVVLRRLPIDAGARYAIRTLTRYAILITGIILTFNAIGIGWGKVQFLAAAISVGLGFGLQEIFANFVSGLIILTERPVRIGDTVTVGNVSGVVSRIQMRATTVTDWDRKELIIPNKEFVTGQVTNWTLTSAILRQKLLVGIAYGSDTDTAKRLLLEVAAANPVVLENPAPMALFWEFGESSLTFELRVYIDQIDQRSIVRDQLHREIDFAFRKAGIVIAFPQRDIHIQQGDIVLPGTARAEDGESREAPE